MGFCSSELAQASILRVDLEDHCSVAVMAGYMVYNLGRKAVLVLVAAAVVVENVRRTIVELCFLRSPAEVVKLCRNLRNLALAAAVVVVDFLYTLLDLGQRGHCLQNRSLSYCSMAENSCALVHGCYKSHLDSDMGDLSHL